MMSLRYSDIIKLRFLTLVFLFLSISTFISAQTSLITGQINKYAKITAVGSDNVTVDDVSDFAPGDTVMIIQMAGVEINASATLPGNFQNVVGNPGAYEILIISAINSGTRLVSFSRNLLYPAKLYDPLGKVQLVKVRSVSNAVVNSELTCTTWDSTTVRGGVLAFIVKGTLTLNANINVSGRGFKGGKVAQGSGYCQENDDSLRHYFYNIWSTASGYKGEGLGFRNSTGDPVYPDLARGKGVTLTGGGGGNGHYSGGGGGSNYGAGSSGDVEVSGCVFQYLGGNGGLALGTTPVSGGVFFGGGGGASVYTGTASTSAGGSGGGIVIILADSIAGNGRVISANGAEPPANTITTSGAGGGGGGGSVILSTRHFKSNPIINANGGKGGNTVNAAGAGGGGGGGLIWTKAALAGTATTSGGLSGLNNGINPNKNGSPGAILTNLNLPLNGFLFNAIYSTVSQNQIDSICQGMTPPQFAGTLPTGGNGTYTYKWQKSYNETDWTDEPGTDVNYTPVQTEMDTVWFRRIVSDGAGMTDISKSVKIIVHQIITGNLVGRDTTVCFNQDPDRLYPLNSGPSGGTKIYYYQWERSSNNITWAAAEGTNNIDDYDPPVLTGPQQYFHRIVNSGACTNTSSSVTVTILPSITGNTVTADQTICEGSIFSNLTGSSPSGGASSYTYLWKSSSDNLTWSPAGGTNSGISYDPLNDTPGTYFYKRIVYSGLNNTCQDTSTSVRLVSHPVITNNSISSDQTICEGSAPAMINGTVPEDGAGPGTYTYQWQNSSNGTDFINMNGVTTEDFAGIPLTSSTWYRRVAYSSVCSDISGDIKVTVDPAITNYTISLGPPAHDTLCTGQTPALLQGVPSGGLGTFTYTWASSNDNINFNSLASTDQTYQSGSLASTTWFRRTVTSGQCSESSVLKITILPALTGNTITANQRVCNDEPPALLSGPAPSGGDGVFRYLWEKKDAGSVDWETAPGISNIINYQPPVLGGDTQYRRNAFSGENNCCTSVSSPVTIIVDTMPLNITAGRDTTLLPYQFAMNLEGGFQGTGTCLWRVISSEGDPVFGDASDMNTGVTKLGFGDNILEFSVENNSCIADPVEVIISVPKILIPQAISPNGDLFNQYFRVDGLEFTNNELVIINSGGAVVFRKENYRSDDPSEAWEGLDNNGDPLPEGTYYYLLTIKGAKDISVPEYTAHISGFIIIRR